MMNRALSKMSCCILQPCLLMKQLNNNRNPSLYSPSRNLQSGNVMNLRSRQQKQKLVARGYNPEISSGSYGEDRGKKEVEIHDDSVSKDSSSSVMKPNKLPLSLILAGLLLASCLIISAVAFVKGGPSAFMAAFSKSGFTAAFSLIFISEIGDKTFFIAALMAMQYDKGLVLLGSMVALSLMTILSVIIGLMFHKVPAQFQTTLPIGEYAAVALLLYFGFKSIKNAWDLPSDAGNKKKDPSDLGEFTEAEELVKERVEKKLTAPLDIFRDVFSLIFFAEWGDRSMLATIALGAAQSPVGVASGAIAGHLVATLLAVIGGAFLANYISEKLVGYVGGGLFLVFAGATLLGVF